MFEFMCGKIKQWKANVLAHPKNFWAGGKTLGCSSLGSKTNEIPRSVVGSVCKAKCNPHLDCKEARRMQSFCSFAWWPRKREGKERYSGDWSRKIAWFCFKKPTSSGRRSSDLSRTSATLVLVLLFHTSAVVFCVVFDKRLAHSKPGFLIVRNCIFGFLLILIMLMVSCAHNRFRF